MNGDLGHKYYIITARDGKEYDVGINTETNAIADVTNYEAGAFI